MSTGQILLLGALAGVTIFIGLPMGRVQGISQDVKAFLSATATARVKGVKDVETPLPGVAESTQDVFLNLKKLAVNVPSGESMETRLEAKGPKAVTGADVSEDDVTAQCAAHLAAYKVPKIVQFVDTLPKSGSGKVMWRLLQDEEAARSAATD